MDFRICKKVVASGAKLLCSCGIAGDSVKPVTVRAMLKPALTGQVRDEAYFFCANPDCNLAYFSPDGLQVFTKDDVVVRIGVKETHAPRPLCYCFGHSYESMRDEWIATGRITAIGSVRSQMISGGCRCQVTNPRGSCCIGDLTSAAREIASTFAVSAQGGCARFPEIPDWDAVETPSAREAVEGVLEFGWNSKGFEGMGMTTAWVLAILLRLYADSGKPPSYKELAAHTGISEERIHLEIDDLRRRDLVILYEKGGAIKGAYPFTEEVTGHTVTFVRTQLTLNTMCFVDALGAAAMCRENALVRSACRLCGVSVNVDIHDGGMVLRKIEPQGMCVWVGFRASCGCAADSLCREMIPFCCEEHLAQWKETREGDGRLLSVAEAFQVGKSLFADRALRNDKT